MECGTAVEIFRLLERKKADNPGHGVSRACLLMKRLLMVDWEESDRTIEDGDGCIARGVQMK